jgi:catechol 2,3-dioxygenase-like lactoylglutathione lyase family enzyme
MKLNSVSGVTFYVKDLEKTTAFYEALGFRIGKQEDNHVTCYVNWFWVDLIAADKEDDPTRKKDAALPHKGAGAYLYIKVDNADEYHKGLQAHGIKPAGEPQKRPSGNREFMVVDPNGYKLMFFDKK